MAQSQRQTRTEYRNGDDGLLDQTINETVRQKMCRVRDELESKVEKIAEVLPEGMRREARRLTLRAQSIFNRDSKLWRCSTDSFIKVVIEAAELGLAVDGRLAYAIPYGKEAQLQIDYKGLVAIARRSGHVVDVYAQIVREKDKFKCGWNGPTPYLEHTFDHSVDRGPTRGAYAVAILPNDRWRFEWMDIQKLEAIRKRSRAANSGPWVTDTDEMQKKTVIRNILKTLCFDTAFSAYVDIDDREYTAAGTSAAEPAETAPEFVPNENEVFAMYKDDIENGRVMDSILNDIGYDEHEGKLTSAEADELRAILGKQAKQEAAETR